LGGEQSRTRYVLDDNVDALKAYLVGDQASPLVVGYFERAGLFAAPQY
jgi:hypothetical protein